MRVARRRALPFIAFLAIAIQCLVIQTHIHSATPGWTMGTLSQAATPAADNARRGAADPSLPSGRYGPASDSTNCPLCAEALLGGHFLALADAVFVAPGHRPAAVLDIAAARIVRTPSHSWQGRGPPRI